MARVRLSARFLPALMGPVTCFTRWAPAALLVVLALAAGPTDAARAPLVDAAGRGQVDKIRTLVKRGVDVEGLDEYGRTPLMKAAERGQADSILVLVELGANTETKLNKHGATALLVAASHGREEAVSALLTGGAEVDAVDKFGKTALMKAAESFKEDHVGREKVSHDLQ